jgi:hypothetical protein
MPHSVGFQFGFEMLMLLRNWIRAWLFNRKSPIDDAENGSITQVCEGRHA